MVETLHFQLMAAHTLFQRLFLKRIRAVHPELLPGQPKIIDFLMSRESAFQREIAEACLLEPPTLCLILDKMDEAGLVQRQKMPESRKNMVTLSEKGRLIGADILRIFAATEDQLCSGMTSENRESFLAALKILHHNAEERLHE